MQVQGQKKGALSRMGWEWAWFEIKLILVNVPFHIQTYVAIVGWGYCCLIKTIDVLMKYV